MIDREIPVILYGLDMYHLSFHKSYYHKKHIEGHVILLVGYDDEYLYVHDNSKDGVERINYYDLKKAWEHDFTGVCKKFTYFGIDIKENTERNVILRKAFGIVSDSFLHPPVNFLGIKGYDKLIKEIKTWSYPNDVMRKIFKNFIYFTASVIPELPKELDPDSPNISRTHKGGRDKTSTAIHKYKEAYEITNYIDICNALDKSGNVIEEINREMLKDILDNHFGELEKYAILFTRLKEAELQLFDIMNY